MVDSKLAITGLSSMLFTGLVSWLSFGNNALSIHDHEKPAAHSAQIKWNMNQEKWNSLMDMRVTNIETVIEEISDRVADKVIQSIRQEGRDD